MATQVQTPELRRPSNESLINLFKKSIADDKPVLFDYWAGSLEKSVSIGVREANGTKERILVRSEDEYTSPISNIFRSGTEFIIVTENSIYVVDAGIAVKRIF
jgi:hypothetical protein